MSQSEQDASIWIACFISLVNTQEFLLCLSSLQTMENVQNIPSTYISVNHEKLNCTTKKKKKKKGSSHCNPHVRHLRCYEKLNTTFFQAAVQITHQIVYLHQDVSYNKWCQYSIKHKSVLVSKPALYPTACFSF
jgi:hypothetical protein